MNTRKLKKILCYCLLTFFICVAVTPCWAEMSSTNYTISQSVLSSGGMEMTSSNYLLNGTLGQPSPIGTSSSGNYRLEGGFWPAVQAAVKKVNLSWLMLLL